MDESLMENSLVRINAFSQGEDGVWRTSVQKDKFDYSDGDAEENYLLKVMQRATDRSSWSDELEDAARDWSSEYHLTSRRANVIRALNLEGIQRVLEIGCGCGALTRFLAEQGLEVHAVEGSSRRAQIARLRCDAMPNVTVINANFNDLQIPEAGYDLVLFNGVLEYAGKYDLEGRSPRDAALAMLSRALTALKPDGAIIVAIENRLGFKYVAGATEDHFGLPYFGVNGYPEIDSPLSRGKSGIQTWDKKQWQSMLAELGDVAAEFYYPFPDYKLPMTLLSQEFIERDDKAWQTIANLQSRDYIADWRPGVDERQFWRAADEMGMMDKLSNSFVLVIARESGRASALVPFDFVHYPRHHRRAAYRMMTRKDRVSKTVKKIPIFEQEDSGTELIRHLAAEDQYLSQILLSELWLDALQSLPEKETLRTLLKEYYAYLQGAVSDSGNTVYDLLPPNILVDDERKFTSFDLEWETAQKLEPEFVLFRALIVMALNHRDVLASYCGRYHLTQFGDFVGHAFDLLDIDKSRIVGFAALDDQFQERICRPGSRLTMAQLLEMPFKDTAKTFEPRLYWGEQSLEEKPVASLEIQERHYVLGFDLPAEAVGMDTIRFDPTPLLPEVDWRLFRLFRVTWKIRDGQNVLFEINDRARLNEKLAPVNARYLPKSLGGVFAVTADDPQIYIPLNDHAEIASDKGYRFEIEMDWPPYTVDQAEKDEVMIRETALDEKLRQRDRQVLEMQLEREELALIKSSKAWKFIQYMRGLVYERMLGKIPVLRGLFLTAKYHGLKPVLRKVADLIKSGQRAEAINALKYNVGSAFDATELPYDTWRRHHAPDDETLNRQREDWKEFQHQPLISIVTPVYNTDPGMLQKAIASVLAQTYSNWELCIADDASTERDTLKVLAQQKDDRIKVIHLESNLNISGATNQAISAASGDYVAFMDHDDELSADALYEVVKTINDTDAELIYSDEDFIDFAGQFSAPHFKPDYSPDLLLSHNYITHFVVVKRALMEQAGLLDSNFDGAQDYDFLLRVTEKTDRIQHIPKVLYHWRVSESSTSFDSDTKPAAHANGAKALRNALARRGIEGEVEDANQNCFYRVKRKLSEPLPLVSIVIPFRDKPDLLRMCIDSILGKSTYRNFEIIGVSNHSEGISTYETMREYSRRDSRVRFVECNEEFNFSRLVNYGVEHVRGEHVVLMNNDIEIITPDWIEAMLEHSQREEVGAVGAKLYYPEERIQHAGVIVGLGGYAAHSHRGVERERTGYFNRANIIQNLSAVTAAMLMVKKSAYEEVDGFDEWYFGIAYNDVDFCLKLREKGYLNIFTPFAEAYHHESMSRGYDDMDPAKKARFDKEKDNFYLRYLELLRKGDPYYNIHLTRDAENFEVRTRFD